MDIGVVDKSDVLLAKSTVVPVERNPRWTTKRGKARSKARHCLNQRLDASASTSTRLNGAVSVVASQCQCTIVQEILWRIIQNNVSSFSLPYIESNYDLLNLPFSVEYLWWNHNQENPNTDDSDTTIASSTERTLVGEQSLLSRYGPQHLQILRQLASQLSTCTILEFACWIRRHSIVGNLIQGGINPFLRGQAVFQSNVVATAAEPIANDALYRLRIPISMKRYIIQRLVDRRVLGTILMNEEKTNSPTCSYCQICGQPAQDGACGGTSAIPLLQIDSICQQHHIVCEPCLWSHIERHAECPDRVDCVDCPLCWDRVAPTPAPIGSQHERHARRQASAQAFAALPPDAAALRASSRRRPPPTLQARNWATAAPHLVGYSQQVRRDRFWNAVATEQVAIVQACLEAGMEVSSVAGHGATALVVAAAMGAVAVVRVLLHYGAEPMDASSHGGITAWDVALWHHQRGGAVWKVLEEAGDAEEGAVAGATVTTLGRRDEMLSPYAKIVAGVETKELRYCTDALQVEMLIDWTSPTAGAGSFVVDNFLSQAMVDALHSLWKAIPVETTKRTKILCSRRSYFYDACGIIAEMVADVVSQAISNQGWGSEASASSAVFVHPSMRFLCYQDSGTVLAPHVDLSRTDPKTGQRSTHSFLCYLTDCLDGGETVLLRALTGPECGEHVASVSPRTGRLLLFPHSCPHEGVEVVDVPKLLIRGEVYIPPL